jgi:hypothetical protein
MLKLTSRKFQINTSASKLSSQGLIEGQNEANEFDLGVCGLDFHSSSPKASKSSKSYEIDTTFGLDFSKKKLSKSGEESNEDLSDREVSTHVSTTTDLSFEESDNDSNICKSSTSFNNVSCTIGVSLNDFQNYSEHPVSYANNSCAPTPIDANNAQKKVLEVSAAENTIFAGVDKTNSIITEDSLSADEKPKKKTRRGGKRAKRQRVKAQAIEEEQVTEPIAAVKVTKEKVKYKTELCKNWIEKGKCSYSVRCRYAHGPHELVQTQVVVPQHKTTNCSTYHTQNFCNYGVR